MIELIAAARAVLHRPELSRRRIERRRLHVAMPVRPDLGKRVGAADERIVARHRAVGIDAHDLPLPLREILRAVAVGEAIALRDQQGAIVREHETRAEVPAAAHLRLLPVDHLHVLEPIVGESGAGHRGAGIAALSRLGKGQVDEPVFREARIERDVEQSALPAGEHLRHSPQWRRERPVARHDAKAPQPLGHEQPSVGEEGKRPRMLKSRRDRLRPEHVRRRGWRRRLLRGSVVRRLGPALRKEQRVGGECDDDRHPPRCMHVPSSAAM